MAGILKPFTGIQALGRLIGKRQPGQALQNATALSGAGTPSETGLATATEAGMTRSRDTFQVRGTEGLTKDGLSDGQPKTGIARIKRKRKRNQGTGLSDSGRSAFSHS